LNLLNLQQINGGTVTTVPGESVAVPAAPAAAGSGPFVCTFENDQLGGQHFTYIDVNGNLQDCWYDDAFGWRLWQVNGGRVTTVPGEDVFVPAAPAAALSVPFVCTFGNQLHFTYVDVNNNLQDCWYDGDAQTPSEQWHLQQINGGTVTTVPGEYVAVPAAPAAAGADLFVCTFGDQQHFVYFDSSEAGNLQDCWYDDASGWHLQQINGGTVTTVPGEYVAVPAAPAAAVPRNLFVCTFGGQQHFTYSDRNGNLQDCWYDDASGWHLQQINGGTVTTVPGEYVAVPAAPAMALADWNSLFVCTFGGQQHFTYSDRNGNFQDCWYDDASGWGQHLMQINGGTVTTVPGEDVGASAAPVGTSLFVCTFGNTQHFTYIDDNNNLQDCWS